MSDKTEGQNIFAGIPDGGRWKTDFAAGPFLMDNSRGTLDFSGFYGEKLNFDKILGGRRGKKWSIKRVSA